MKFPSLNPEMWGLWAQSKIMSVGLHFREADCQESDVMTRIRGFSLCLRVSVRINQTS